VRKSHRVRKSRRVRKGHRVRKSRRVRKGHRAKKTLARVTTRLLKDLAQVLIIPCRAILPRRVMLPLDLLRVMPLWVMLPLDLLRRANKLFRVKQDP
jgi:hypothetical protein